MNEVANGVLECISGGALDIQREVEGYNSGNLPDLEICLDHMRGSLKAITYMIDGLEREIQEVKIDFAFGAQRND